MSAMEEAVAEAPAEGKEGSGRVEALRETFRAELGSGREVLEALDKVLGSLGTLGSDPPAEATVTAVLHDIDYVARRLRQLGRGSSPSRAWPEDAAAARHAAELSYSVGRLVEQGIGSLGLEPWVGSPDSAGLRETFAIRFGDEVGSRGPGRRHLELIVGQVFEAVAVAKIVAPRPMRQSPLVRDLAAAEAELRYAASVARRFAASVGGAGQAGGLERWQEVVLLLPAQLVRLADQAREGARHA